MKHSVSRTNLFMVELVFDLLIFVLCAAVCVGLLVHARNLSRESTALTQAVYLAQSAADACLSGSPDTADAPNGFTVLVTDVKTENGVRSGTVQVLRADTVIYTLPFAGAEGVLVP